GLRRVSRIGVQFGQPEVEQLYVTLFRDEYVCRFDIAMDNFRGVGRFQTAYDLDCEIQQLVTPHWLPGDPVPKSHALQQLHRHKSAAVDLVDLVNCADIGVIEGGG